MFDTAPVSSQAADESQARAATSMRLRRAALAVASAIVFLGALAVGGTAYWLGWVGLAMATMLPAAALMTICGVLVAALRRHIDWKSWHVGGTTARWRYLVRGATRSLGWSMIGGAAFVSLPRSMVAPGEFTLAAFAVIGSVVWLVAVSWVPRRRPLGLVTALVVALGAFSCWQLVKLAVPAKSEVALAAPLTGEWLVHTGGNSVLVNHHYALRQQRYAIDLAMPYSRGEGTTRDAVEDFPSFGAPVLAPGDGRVVRVDDSRPDQPIGSMDASHPLGNFVVVQLANDRYVLLAHLKAGSILVRQGDRVRAGATVAAVGNSGNSSEPHLHLQVQSGPDLMNESGTGWADITTTPFSFRSDQGGTAAHKVPRMGDRLVFEAVAP